MEFLLVMKTITKMNKIKLGFRFLFKILGLVFVAMNLVAYLHAYKFTHFSEPNTLKTKNVADLNKFFTFAPTFDQPLAKTVNVAPI